MSARIALAAVASLAYVALSQWLMTRSPPSPWSAVVLVGPMLAIVAVWAWRHGHRWVAALVALAIAALVTQSATGRTAVQAETLWLAQHVVMHMALAAWFGATLRPGANALITTIALRVHGHLTPAMRHYTRQVTAAWVVYFVAMAALSLVLFHTARFEAWTVFANIVTPLAVALMFAGEYLLRYRWHPEFERVRMMDAVRAYLQPDSTHQAALPEAPKAKQ